MANSRFLRSAVFLLLMALIVPAAFAQQTGSISGRVTSGGELMPGVTVEARSNVLPQARVTTTTETGEYRLPQLPPGRYTVTFNLSGMSSQTRTIDVLLNQETQLDASLGMETISESITVSAEGSQIDTSSTEIKSAVSSELIERLPVGQEYRDLVKLSPGVQYSENQTRGPSAGGSGQDNVYNFDGVNVTLPQYGTLSAEPSSHDIAQVSVSKGGARAIDFNRAAGFTIDSVSKSGTSEFTGQAEYQILDDSMSSDLQSGSDSRFDEDRTWAMLNVGGPIVRDRLFFYGSYYRPTRDRANRSNLYGDLPEFESTRDEYFGKLTFTPTSTILLNGSYRASDREETGSNVGGATTAPSVSSGGASKQTIGILEGSWIVNNRSYATFKGTDFAYETAGRPDLILGVQPSTVIGTQLDLGNLDRMGTVSIPCPTNRPSGAPCTISAAPANDFNTFLAPYIDRYGFVQDGQRTGGGVIGAARDIEQNDFFRRSYQAAYNYTIGSAITHDLHVGYQWNEDAEDLQRVRNGWGDITLTGGRASRDGTPIFYTARYIRGQLGEFPLKTIHSEAVSKNIEVNDTMRWNNWTFNLGVMLSHDTLYGQGLREDSSTLSGYVSAPGNQYKMYEIPWEKQIQPRIGAMWAYDGNNNVYGNYARYNPSVSSLPRAASWDRNTVGLFYDAFFDEDGKLFATAPVGSSSGKLFVDDLDPRYTDEFLLGTSRNLTAAWSGRLYTRYRYSTNFWEDTNNNARVLWGPEGTNRELYIPDLSAKLAQIGSGSSYVIAELDGAFTKYWEASLESEWRGSKAFVRGAYTWSHYYGNFDQDNTTVGNDANIFIGSSNIADGPGRQIWDNRYGDLHGDRRHMLKLYGAYSLPWNASTGAYAVYQSGEPWEAWDYKVYKDLPGFGTSTSDTIRYAEPAGSRRTDAHYQFDLNYTQRIPVAGHEFQIAADMFNVTDNQTGYNPQPSVNTATFGRPRNFYAPRRYQIAARFTF